MLLPEIGTQGQEKLQAAKVLIVGVGGLGSPIALYLAGAGVGTIGLIDHDVVDISNLQRQVLYNETEIGSPKALSAKRHLEQLNSDIRIQAHPCRLTSENALDLVSQYDIIADGCDNFATRYAINDACVVAGKIYVYGAIRAFEGQVSVFNHPSGQTTYRTLYPDEQAHTQLPPPPKGVLGVTPGVVGCLEAAEILKLITGFGKPLIDKLLTIDIRTLQSYIISL